MPYLIDVCFKEISYMNWRGISGNSIEYPFSVLAMVRVSRQHLSMYNYPEDDKKQLVDKVNHFFC